jgi:hypothetical protein
MCTSRPAPKHLEAGAGATDHMIVVCEHVLDVERRQVEHPSAWKNLA